MVNILGIVLKLSVDNKEVEGYNSYFTQYQSVNLSRTYYMELKDYPAWGMSFSRFKWIHASFHPKVGKSLIGDKYHQLRHALNTVNQAA